jgi:hypothetical protein
VVAGSNAECTVVDLVGIGMACLENADQLGWLVMEDTDAEDSVRDLRRRLESWRIRGSLDESRETAIPNQVPLPRRRLGGYLSFAGLSALVWPVRVVQSRGRRQQLACQRQSPKNAWGAHRNGSSVSARSACWACTTAADGGSPPTQRS